MFLNSLEETSYLSYLVKLEIVNTNLPANTLEIYCKKTFLKFIKIILGMFKVQFRRVVSGWVMYAYYSHV